MRKIEKLSIFLIIVVFISWLFRGGIDVYIQKLLSYDNHNVSDVLITMNWVMKIMFTGIIPVIIRIMIGLWLFVVVKKEKGYVWLWALLGITFGFLSLILYYCIKIYEFLQRESSRSLNKE